MAVCRWSDNCDVYVFYNIFGGIDCCGCRFGTDYNCATEGEMIRHLELHRQHGHQVPEAAFDRLRRAAIGKI